MSFWAFDISAGRLFLDFAWLGLLIAAGMLLRSRSSLLRRSLLPANLIGGTIGLLIAGNGLEWINLTSDRLGVYIYHLLALLFIGLSLRAPHKNIGLSSVKTGILFICTYLIQGILGLSITFLLIYTLMPGLFAGIGLLPPLAFGMNPGIAFTIGQHWEAYGFESGGIVGLTFAAVGFLAAYTTGVWVVKRGIVKGEATYLEKEHTPPSTISLPTGLNMLPSGFLTASSRVAASLILHTGLIGIVYLLTYSLLTVAEHGLHIVGAEQEASTLWSFHFVFAAVVALAFRKALDTFGLAHPINDATMTQISTLFMDLMIAASIAAISFTVVAAYWMPLLLISVVVVGSTFWLVSNTCNSVFSDYQLERTAAVYGNMTGTLQSGLLLLSILDEDMKSPVSYNLVYGSGIALILGFPLLLLINAPVHYFDEITTGFATVLLALIAYLVLLLLALYYLNGDKSSSGSSP